MKSFILPLAVLTVLVPAVAQGVAYIKYEDIKGETEDSSVATPPARATATASATPARSVATPVPSPQEGQFDAFLEIDGVKGESSDEKTPTPKPQENQAPGIEPDDIDYDGDDTEAKESGEKGGTEDINIGVGELRSNFGVLLGGGGASEGGVPADLSEVGDILKVGAAEKGRPMEQISMNYEKIQVKYSKPAKLIGLIPLTVTADIEIPLEGEGQVKVKFPWWAFLVSGKSDAGAEVVGTLADVVQAKHDTIKNAIGNIR